MYKIGKQILLKYDLEKVPLKEDSLIKMWQLFGEETDAIINELNESLVA
jgi:hypothetical protein